MSFPPKTSVSRQKLRRIALSCQFPYLPAGRLPVCPPSFFLPLLLPSFLQRVTLPVLSCLQPSLTHLTLPGLRSLLDSRSFAHTLFPFFYFSSFVLFRSVPFCSFSPLSPPSPPGTVAVWDFRGHSPPTSSPTISSPISSADASEVSSLVPRRCAADSSSASSGGVVSLPPIAVLTAQRSSTLRACALSVTGVAMHPINPDLLACVGEDGRVTV